MNSLIKEVLQTFSRWCLNCPRQLILLPEEVREEAELGESKGSLRRVGSQKVS